MVGFRRVKVWEKSHRLTLATYKLTRSFPTDERFGLVAQLRRAAASIGANIAEGCARSTKREFARFLYIALGSASEYEYHLLLAFDLGFVEKSEYVKFEASAIEVKRMLTGFIKKLTSDV